MGSLPYFSTLAADNLSSRIKENVDRYVAGHFADEISEPGATLELAIDCDLVKLSQLDDKDGDLDNARRVWESLRSLTPNLACENRIWTRLCHGEALDYSRSRWLAGKERAKIASLARIHLFGATQTMYRDDNALGRLWWTAYIVHKTDPDDFDTSLSLIFKTADIRSNFVERVWMTTRQVFGRALLGIMKSDPWVTAAEANFRNVMKALNVNGAGIAFEAMSAKRVEEVFRRTVDDVKSNRQTIS